MSTSLLNIETYRQILGCMIQDQGCAYDGVKLLMSGFFLDRDYRIIFENITAACARGEIIDPYDPHLLDGVEHIKLENILTWRDEARPQGFEIQARRLTEAHQRRLIVHSADRMKQAAMDGEKDISQVWGDFERYYRQAVLKMDREETCISDILKNTIKDIEERQARGSRIGGISTGFKKLDELLDGLIPGRYYILAAYTSVGKTSFALNTVLNFLRAGKAAAYFSLEMVSTSLCRRLLTIAGDLSDWHLKRNELEYSEFQRYKDAQTEIESFQSRLQVFTTGGLSLESIIMDARKMKFTQGLDVVVIDYIQQIRVSDLGKNTTYERQLSEISRGLQALARENGIVVIALSQFSREAVKAEKGGNYRKNPPLWGLRGSGMLENDADAVILLDRDKENNPDTVIWRLEKNRYGPLGKGEIKFKVESQVMTE
jgi:replicative DNA helicase